MLKLSQPSASGGVVIKHGSSCCAAPAPEAVKIGRVLTWHPGARALDRSEEATTTRTPGFNRRYGAPEQPGKQGHVGDRAPDRFQNPPACPPTNR
jgi:hypothetical protein